MNLDRFKRIVAGIVPNEKGCKIWPMGTTEAGYPQLNLDGKNVYGHRLALELKLGRPLAEGLMALHECDTPSCLADEHLEEGTQKKNSQDASKRGRLGFGDRNGTRTKPECKAVGSRNGRSILTEDQVLEIIRLDESGVSGREIGRRLNMSQGGVWQILRGVNWSHLTGRVRSK